MVRVVSDSAETVSKVALITASNSLRPCAVVAEHRKISGNFSNHPAMRSVNAAMFADTSSGVPRSVLVADEARTELNCARAIPTQLQVDLLRRQSGIEQRGKRSKDWDDI